MVGAGLVIRMVLSLALVLLLLWAGTTLVRRGGGHTGTPRLRAVARTSLGRTTSVAVVRVGERALVLGVTEHQVTLLAEADPAQFPEPGARRTSPAGGAAPASGSPREIPPLEDSALAGSVLSPATWRVALEALRDRTARRG